VTPAGQHRLAVELAVWIADQVRRFGAFKPAAGGDVLDSATSPLTGACYTLWGVGGAVTTDADGNPPDDRGYGSPPPHFRLAGEIELRRALDGRKITPKDFSRLIGDFAGMREHAPEAFELSADWFRPSLPAPLLDALVAAEFLECSDVRCRWLDPMAQWLEWSAPRLLWESRAESEARHLRKYGPMWNTMPAWIRAKVVDSGKVNQLLLVDAIRRFWDGQWHSQPLPDWQDQKRLIDAMESGRQIQQLVESGRLSVPRRGFFARLFARFG